MRYLKIFLLSLQEVFEARSRILVWFFLGCVTPFVLLLFWRGAKSIPGWTSAEITSYYLLIIILSAFLMTHHEEKMARIDIQEGGLTAYLLKPFSYLLLILFNELPYRLLQGIIGFLLFVGITFLFPQSFVFNQSPLILLFSIMIALCALCLTFTFKSTVGLIAFWMTEVRGALELMEAVLTIFSGILMPIAFFPQWLEQLAYFLPFPYMIYFPVLAFEGKLASFELLRILGVQCVWIMLFYLLYLKLWQAGVKKYTAVGQ